MDLEQIKSLIDVLKGTDVTEIDVEEEGMRVHIKKGFMEQVEKMTPHSVSNPVVVEEKTEQSAKEQEQESAAEEIEAPMVGTFYRAPAPDAEPFIEVGDIVKPGTTLCIIEAMKLMNEIESEIGGKIIDIVVEDGQAVEYGQPLFIVEPV